jgi:hypothetical protein
MTARPALKAGFAVSDVPDAKTVIQHVKDTSDFAKACAEVAPSRPAAPLLRFPMKKALVAGFRAAVAKAIAAHGLHGWLSSEGRTTDGYLSLSLTHNPDLSDPGVTDVHQATLGTSVNRQSEFYYGSTGRFRALKNTYFDTYGFRVPTPAARIGALGEFLSQCRLSLVRSRLSVLYGDEGPVPFEIGWHRDEPVFENLRINIPLETISTYGLQIEHAADKPHEESPTMSTHHLAAGSAYTFDTHRPHRVFAAARSSVKRVHLVLGFSPWLRYNGRDQAWEPNEYFGRVHPFDIVRGGGLHPALRSPE